MRIFANCPLANRLSSLWNGPEDLPRNLKLEWRFVAVRWLGIASLGGLEIVVGDLGEVLIQLALVDGFQRVCDALCELEGRTGSEA